MSNVLYDMYGQIIILNSVTLLLDLIYFERFDVTTDISKLQYYSKRGGIFGAGGMPLVQIRPVYF